MSRVAPGVRAARGFAIASLLVLVVVLANNFALLVSPLLVFLALLLWAVFGTLAAVGFAVRALWSREQRAQQLAWLAVSAVLSATSPILAARLGWPIRRIAFARACDQAESIAVAVAKYEADHREPPPSLDALVPSYLGAVPWTRMPAFPSFEYARGRSPTGEVVWYDLGGRGGRPVAGLWVYPDGPFERAILVLELDEHGRLRKGGLDRMPKDVAPTAFDRTRWDAAAADRMAMALGLRDEGTLLVPGKSRQELVDALGEPAGHRELVGAPWELWVSTPTGGINFDGLLFFPTKRYPRSTHGGRTELIGSCAYVHD